MMDEGPTPTTESSAKKKVKQLAGITSSRLTSHSIDGAKFQRICSKLTPIRMPRSLLTALFRILLGPLLRRLLEASLPVLIFIGDGILNSILPIINHTYCQFRILSIELIVFTINIRIRFE